MKKSNQGEKSPEKYCTMPLPLKDPAEIISMCAASLMTQDTVQHYEQGDSNQPSDAWRAFHLLLDQGAKAKAAALELLASKHSGARIYGVVLLRQIDKVEGTRRLTQLLKDKAAVTYARGCARQESSVSDFSARLLKGEEVIRLEDPRIDKSLQPQPSYEWLNGLVKTAKSIKAGSTREQVLQLFSPDGGKLGSAAQVRYVLKTCRLVKLDIGFGEGSKSDIVSTVSALHLEYPGGLSSLTSNDSSRLEQEHAQWLRNQLDLVLAVKPGMTRAELLKTCDAESGLQPMLPRRYVLQTCPMIKIDVTFQDAPARQSKGSHGVLKIASVSVPALDYVITD